jgi:uncharacterized protein YlxW (UPF0749 family)
MKAPRNEDDSGSDYGGPRWAQDFIKENRRSTLGIFGAIASLAVAFVYFASMQLADFRSAVTAAQNRSDAELTKLIEEVQSLKLEIKKLQDEINDFKQRLPIPPQQPPSPR